MSSHGAVRAWLRSRFILTLRTASVILLACQVACSASQTQPEAAVPDQDAPGRDAVVPQPAASISIVEPAEGAKLARDALDGRDWAAKLALRAQVSHAAKVEFFDGDEPIGQATQAPWTASAMLLREGSHQLRAVALDENGRELAQATRKVEVLVPPAELAGCHAQLTALGIKWARGPETKGVTDPVNIGPTLSGVTFQNFRSATAKPFLVACKMAVRLHELARLLEGEGILHVRTMGVYNYREMRNPKCQAAHNCPLSQHAYATALDIHELKTAALAANVKTDWIIKKPVKVCPGAPEGDKDTLLHRVACKMFEQRIFNVVLTPNYNANHRDHFHVDLTETWAGIRGEELGIDPEVEGLGD